MTKKTKSSTVANGGGGGRNAEAGPWTGLIYWQENLVARSSPSRRSHRRRVALGSAYLTVFCSCCPSVGAKKRHVQG